MSFRGTVANPAQASVDLNGNGLEGIGGLSISGATGISSISINYPGNTGSFATINYVFDKIVINKNIDMNENNIENAAEVYGNSKVQAGFWNGDTGGTQGSMLIGGTAGYGNVYDTIYNPAPTQVFASFSSSADQAIGATDASQVITYNTTDIASSGITRGGTGAEGVITCAAAGKYKVLTKVQFAKASANAATAYVWFRVNGTKVANSSSSITLAAISANALATVEVILDIATSGTIEVLMAGDSTDISAEHLVAETTPYARPANPSVITTVVKLA